MPPDDTAWGEGVHVDDREGMCWLMIGLES